MKIKEFARLCGCNPKTLRYYDSEGLLKPSAVDATSGYRHYQADQAITYIKIKSLQRAEFSIGEIKELLDQSDAEIYEAFERKIHDLKTNLLEIREIQKKYQSEISDMRNKIKELRRLLQEAKSTYDPSFEFGLNREKYAQAVEKVDALLEEILRKEDLSKIEIREEQGNEDTYLENCLRDPDYEILYENHGWHYFKDLYKDLPGPKAGESYFLLFRITADKGDKTRFAGTVIGLMMERMESGPNSGSIVMESEDGYHRVLSHEIPSGGCTVADSTDGSNHFWLLRFTGKQNLENSP